MITTILEVLVAVVVLIVIIAVAALHFLRADDSDTFDDMPHEPRRTRRHPAEPALEPAVVPAERARSRRPEPATEQWAAAGRGGRPADDRGQAAYRDREGRGQDGSSRPAKPERRGSPAASGQRQPVPAMQGTASQGTARQAKAARQADADSGSSDWDKLSDVDYWAELAADKPLTPAAAASSDSPRPARRGAGKKGDAPRPADARPADARPADARSAPRGESAMLPVRQRSQSRSGPAPAGRLGDSGQTEQIDTRAARSGARYGTEPATQSLAALARLGDQPPAQLPAQPPRSPGGQRPGNGQRPASGQRPANGQRPATGQRPAAGGPLPATGQRPAPPPLPQAPAAQISHSGGHARPPQPLDDDPLTSPSFPAINTSDSRSYRTRRPSSSQPSGAPVNGAPLAGGRGSGGYSEPAQPYSPYPVAPERSASVPNGYPVQPAAASAGSPYSAGPVANPYGSYVNAPQPSYPDTGTAHLDAAAYGSGYAAGQQAVAGANWYGSTPDGSQAVSGYLPSPGSPNGVSAAGHSNGAATQNGYSAADYGISYESPLYQGGQPGPAGGHAPGHLAGQYDQRGYGAPELPYGQDGYQGYPGYGGSGR